MNRILSILLITFTMTISVSAQSLSPRQKHLATIAALEAGGNLTRLEPAIREALDGGVTINEIKEAFSQLYAYTGFPRSLNALGVLSKVLENSNGKWTEGKPWERPAEWDDAQKALQQGTEVQTKLSGRPFNYEFCPQNDYYLKAHLFGDIFAGNQLTAADREIVTVAALSALKGVAPQLAAHKAGAVNMGNTQEQVNELCRFLSENGLSQYDAAADACAGDWPKGNPNDAYAQYFTGNSHLSPIKPKNINGEGEKTVQDYANVTFEPGCRNNWHVHHGAHQILICVSGNGIYQEWGKPAIHLKAGDIIDIPEGAKHWHGATKDSWFQHLTTHVKVGGPESNEWLEPVNDEQYNEANKQQ
ncbi:MAG: carboxymuconolactone decarboxylase family protein [Prevotella sp.]|nr:carboxymuconolactone decarboxylase family protein [Prevotella sp.]